MKSHPRIENAAEWKIMWEVDFVFHIVFLHKRFLHNHYLPQTTLKLLVCVSNPAWNDVKSNVKNKQIVLKTIN